MKTLYDQSDKYRALLKKRIQHEFGKLRNAQFDELNAIQTTGEMYDRLLRFNKTQYKKIADECIKYTKCKLTDSEVRNASKLDTNNVVADALVALYLVTGYRYAREAERKRMRTAEEISTAQEYSDRNAFDKSLRKSANLWFTQSAEYGDLVSDASEMATYRAAGIEKVVWRTEKDNKVCDECSALDGEIFDIEDAPPKTHYHCRCHYEPYRGV